MRHFIYTYSEKQRPLRNGHTYKTVRVYRLVSGMPRLIGTLTETFMDEFQLVQACLDENKALPKKAFERHPMGGWVYGNAWSLEQAGIASIYRVT